mmetsp:Transcript_50899/g.65177  ORF Transcript_50899/g.65177 Transcript_50899/m.65177 type:complete len:132 (-) Transcript_50899:311-706(-)
MVLALKKDQTIAIEWYQKAADQGHVAAIQQMKVVNDQRNSFEENVCDKDGQLDSQMAFSFCLNAAKEHNDPKAQHNTGVAYRDGEGVGQDDEKAFYWIKKSAEQGFVDAQWNLGVLYHNGTGIKKRSNDCN